MFQIHTAVRSAREDGSQIEAEAVDFHDVDPEKEALEDQ